MDLYDNVRCGVCGTPYHIHRPSDCSRHEYITHEQFVASMALENSAIVHLEGIYRADEEAAGPMAIANNARLIDTVFVIDDDGDDVPIVVGEIDG